MKKVLNCFFIIILFSLNYKGGSIVFDNVNNITELYGSGGISAEVSTDEYSIKAFNIKDYSKQKKVQAFGSVKIKRIKDGSVFSSRKVDYDYNDNSFIAHGEPNIRNEKDSFYLKSENMYGNFDTEVYSAEKDLYFQDYSRKNDITEIFSTKGNYNFKKKVAVVEGDVIIKKNNIVIKGVKAYYNMDNKTMEIWGSLKKEKEKKENTNKELKSIKKKKIEDNKVVKKKEEDVKINRDKNQKVTTDSSEEESGQVVVEYVDEDSGDDNIIITADYVKYKFMKEELFFLIGKAKVLDKKNNTEIKSDVIDYFRDKHFYRTRGRSSYVDRDIDLILKANQFEFYEKKKVIYAKGDTMLNYLEKNIHAGIFVYFEDKQLATFYSAPYLIDEDGNHVYSNSMKYDLKKNTLLFNGNINGSFMGKKTDKSTNNLRNLNEM